MYLCLVLRVLVVLFCVFRFACLSFFFRSIDRYIVVSLFLALCISSFRYLFYGLVILLYLTCSFVRYLGYLFVVPSFIAVVSLCRSLGRD